MKERKSSTKGMNNEELVMHMMRYSEAGALKQAFVLEAIGFYSKQTISDVSVWPENYPIRQAAWRQCARECIEAIEGR